MWNTNAPNELEQRETTKIEQFQQSVFVRNNHGRCVYMLKRIKLFQDMS